MTCPFCDGKIELTIEVDAAVDRTTGEVYAAASGGTIRVYCECSCAEWNTGAQFDWGIGNGWPTQAECANAITYAIELATKGETCERPE